MCGLYSSRGSSISRFNGDGKYEDVYKPPRAFGLESDKSNGR